MSRDDLIFFREAGQVRAFERTTFDREDLLQSLVADHPEILAGAQISGDPDRPIRWLLVRREARIPAAEGAADRWSVDHLLIDQHGRPTFVEVKRSTDTRLRREVVGQMLDYAANATRYWPADTIRRMAEATWGEADLTAKVQALLEDPAADADAVEAWWNQVREYLRRGEVRLLFVADVIPPELRAIIEFLNEQMPRVEVLGVEVSPYRSGAVEAYVPRVYGQTETARREKQGDKGPRRTTSRDVFLAACPEPARAMFTKLLTAVDQRSQHGWETYWGTKGFSIRVPNAQGAMVSLAYGYPPGVQGNNLPLLQGYVRDIPPPLAERARERFAQAATFESRGQFTLHHVPDRTAFADADALVRALDDLAAMLRLPEPPSV